MSRRKDRERVLEMRRKNPDYRGFRGYVNEAGQRSSQPLVGVTCATCGKRRNVPAGIAAEQGADYVCVACQDASSGASAPPD